MAPKLIDPRAALEEDRKAASSVPMQTAAEAAMGVDVRPAAKRAQDTTNLTPVSSIEGRAKEDFRVFLTLVWRHLLGSDPNPIQLDMAYWMQHGPDRAITMAFRGFSKSWITGAYALWRLYRDPQEQIIVVSGSLKRAVATTNWCLQLIMTMPLLKDLIPKPSYRQSSMMFDVGNCVPQQSASFMAAGIGGQLVGFRGTLIIPDDVETQTNSLTVVMRDKIKEAVKEFESVLLPGGQIKYLGTPHDIESLYLYLLRLKDKHGRPVYEARIWPGLFPSEKEVRAYGPWLAPYITHQLRKHGPSLVGHSTMPQRFTDEDLEGRRAAMGNSEFRLQFMLDLTGIGMDKYPLRLRDLTVMALDDHKGPEEVVWGTTHVERDLPVMGFDGDFYHGPVMVSDEYRRYTRVIAFVDPSGSGTDETALSIVAELFGKVFWLHLWASQEGSSPNTLRAIAKACVRFGVMELFYETNFGSTMFGSLLKPYIIEEWKRFLDARENKHRSKDLPQGTSITEYKSSKVYKEKRILSIMEPVVQQHRLVVNRAVIEWDHASLQKKEGEDTRHQHAFGYQYTHLTDERDCLGHDDRLESLSAAVSQFAEVLGVDPQGLAQQSREEKMEAELEALFGDDVETAVGYAPRRGGKDNRVAAARPQRR